MIVAELFAKLGLKVDGKSFGAGEKMIGAAKAALGGLAAYASVNFLGGVVKDVADTGDMLDELAQKTGAPVEALQELGYAAGFSGVGIEELGGAMGTLARTMDRAKRGSKEQRAALKAAGVAYKDHAGKLRPVDDVFSDLADTFASMPDGPEKAALAVRLFRGQGRALIPVLNEGREGLGKLRQEFRESGAEISGDTAAALAKFNDDQDRLKNTMKGLKVQIVTAVLPALQGLLTKLMAWVKANRALIIDKVTNALRTLGTALKVAYQTLAPIVAGMYRFIEAVLSAADNVGILKYVLVAAAVAIGLSWAGALLPFILLAAAVGAIILIVDDLQGAFQGKKSLIKDTFEDQFNWLVEKLDWYEARMVDLGLLKGKSLVSGKMIQEHSIRTGKGIAQVNSAADFVNGLTPARAPRTPADWAGSMFGKMSGPSKLQERADANARMQQRLALAGTQFGSMFGIGDGSNPSATNATPAQLSNLGARPSDKPTVTIGGITVVAQGADAKEIAKHVREEIDAQLRILDVSTGGKAIP